MEPRTDELAARLLRCPVGCAFLLTIERDQVPVALAVTPPQAFARAAAAVRTFDPWSRDFAQAVPAALSRSGGSSGRPLVDPGVSLPEGDSGHGSALRSPLPWRERVRVRGLPEVTRGVPVRSPRARGSDAAAHRRSRISGPCSHATPATVFAEHRLPAGRAAARRPLTHALSPARGEGAGPPSRRPGGRSERGRGGEAPHIEENPRLGGCDRTPFARPPLMRVQRVAEPPSARRRQPGRASPSCCAGASCCTRSASPRSAPAPRAGCRTARRPGTRRAAGR